LQDKKSIKYSRTKKLNFNLKKRYFIKNLNKNKLINKIKYYKRVKKK